MFCTGALYSSRMFIFWRKHKKESEETFKGWQTSHPVKNLGCAVSFVYHREVKWEHWSQLQILVRNQKFDDMELHQRHNCMEWIGDKHRQTQTISVQHWEVGGAFFLTVKVITYFYHVQRFLIDSPLLVQTPRPKQWGEHVPNSGQGLQSISSALLLWLLGHQYSISVELGFPFWAVVTWYNHPLKVESACEDIVHAFLARPGGEEWWKTMQGRHLPAYSGPAAMRISHHPHPQPGRTCRDLAGLGNVWRDHGTGYMVRLSL